MEIIIVILIIFAVSSWVKGISGQNPNNSGRNPRSSTGGGYARTGSQSGTNNSWTNNKGDYRQNSMARTQEQEDYQKVTNRNDSLRELEGRLSKSLRNLTGEAVRPESRNYARTPGVRNTDRNLRSNNSPVNQSKFNNHSESSAALRDEIQQAAQIWHENLGRMHSINMEFQRHIDQQHADQQKWMRDAQSMDR